MRVSELTRSSALQVYCTFGSSNATGRGSEDERLSEQRWTWDNVESVDRTIASRHRVENALLGFVS